MTLTDRPPTVCLHPGCGAIGQWERGYCPEHSNRTVQRELEQWYKRAPYQRFRKRLLAFNPICQRLIGGEQCRHAASELHHLRAPSTVHELLDWHNTVMLCKHCHPSGRPGTPTWVEGKDYVKTVWRDVSYS